MRIAIIYGLYHPRRPNTVVYVGTTTTPAQRLGAHRTKKRFRNYRMRTLETCSLELRWERERHWIKFWKEKNNRLLNQVGTFEPRRQRINIPVSKDEKKAIKAAIGDMSVALWARSELLKATAKR